MKNYRILSCLGQGAHGVVYLARDLNHRKVALKSLSWFENRGVPSVSTTATQLRVSLTALRELKALQLASGSDGDHSAENGEEHEGRVHVLMLLDCFVCASRLVLVFDYFPTNLKRLILGTCTLLSWRVHDLPKYSRSLLFGLRYLHDHCSLIHRDLKPTNLLLDAHGCLKIADYGLCCLLSDSGASHRPATRWYSPPELLLGGGCHSSSGDMWACGCIIAEMYLRHPLFAGCSDIDQLLLVMKTLGSIDDTSWPDANKLPDFDKIDLSAFASNKRCLSDLLRSLTEDVCHLVECLLVYNPADRLSASQALIHHSFFTKPVFSEKIFVHNKCENGKIVDGNNLDIPSSLESFDQNFNRMLSEFSEIIPL